MILKSPESVGKYFFHVKKENYNVKKTAEMCLDEHELLILHDERLVFIFLWGGGGFPSKKKNACDA